MSVATKGALIGDSIVNQMTLGAINKAVLEAGGSTWTRLAAAGHTTANQLAVWLASSVRGNNTYDWLFYMCGINDDLHGDRTVGQVLADVDAWRADAASQNPNARLYLSIMCPAKQKLDEVTLTGGPDRYALWQAINAGYVARGFRTDLSLAINDGSDNLAASKDSGDHLHPNAAGDLSNCNKLRSWIDADFPDPPPDPPPPFSPTRWQRFRRRGAA